MTGSILAGRYQLVRKLGEGGMGSVWEAIHLGLNTPVAIKLMGPEIASNAESLGRFKREAQAAASLRCPNVVQILDYGVDEGKPYIAMELLEGENLQTRLLRLGRLSAQSTAALLSQIARALDRAHQMGIVHRDLKPDNLFIVRDGDQELVKVLDFGLAKRQTGVLGDPGVPTRSGALLGTPYYMSPEQATGSRAVDHRTDLWAMAVIAFECVTGSLPFEGATVGSLVLSICTGPIPVPSQSTPVPPGFDEWFACGVARNPENRFQSATGAARELSRVAGLIERSSPPGLTDLPVDAGGLPPRVEPTGEAIAPDPGSLGSAAAPILPIGAAMPRASKSSKAVRIAAWGFGALVVLGIATTLIRAGHDEPPVSGAASAQPSAPTARSAEDRHVSFPVVPEVTPAPSADQERQEPTVLPVDSRIPAEQRTAGAGRQRSTSTGAAAVRGPSTVPSGKSSVATDAPRGKSRLDTEPGF